MSQPEEIKGTASLLFDARYTVTSIMVVTAALSFLLTLFFDSITGARWWMFLLLVLTTLLVSSISLIHNRRFKEAASRQHSLETNWIQAQEQIESQNARLEAILRHLPVGVIIAEAPSMNTILFNRQAENIAGTILDPSPISTSPQVAGYHLNPSPVSGYHLGGQQYASDEMPLSRAIQKGEIVTNEEVLLWHADNRRVIVEMSAGPIHNRNGQIIAGVTILHDVTERKQAQVGLLHWQRITEAFARTPSLDQVAAIMMQAMMTGVDSNAAPECCIYLADSAGETLHLVSRYGLLQPKPILSLAETRAEGDPGFIEEAYRTGEPAWFAGSVPMLERYYPDIGEGSDQAYKSGSALPLSTDDGVIGVLAIFGRRAIPYSKAGREMALAGARQCERVIYRIKLTEKIRETATVEERHRLARDLHDAVSQTLFSASLTAETLLMELDQTQDDLRPQLERLVELTKGAFAEMRTLLVELRPEAILKAPLSDLLQHLITAACVRKKIEGELLADVPTRPLSPKAQVALYRIAQESLNNILKHSQATLFRIELVQEGDQIRLSISDDGRGFDASGSFAGLGLGSMSERASEIGAQMKIVSTPGEGTTVTVTCPILEEKVST